MQNKSDFLDTLKFAVFSVLAVILIRTFLFTPVAVEGASMMPTYENGDRVIINKTVKTFDLLERFDVIVFHPYEGQNKRHIKRIIGMPGDQIAYENDLLYINGQQVDEPYLEQYQASLEDMGDFTYDFTLSELTGVMTVPEGHYFVLGDNRRNSTDSRDPRVGFVSEKQILGESVLRIYPFTSFGLVD